MHHSKLPSQNQLKLLLNYNPVTGVFTRAVTKGGKVAGSIAGYVDKDGRRRIGLMGNEYFSSRLAWLFMTGLDPEDMEVDHINRSRLDDRFSNLRLVSRSENASNRGVRKDSKTGIQCVKQRTSKSGGKYLLAKVIINKKEMRKIFPFSAEGMIHASAWVKEIKITITQAK